VLTGLIARELGGGRFAQGMAMFAVLASTLFLRAAVLFQPVVLDQLCWTVGFFALIKIGQTGQGRWWLLLGLARSGTAHKIQHRLLLYWRFRRNAALQATRRAGGPLALFGGTLALAVGSASVIGQVRLDFPVAMHMLELQSGQLQRVSVSEFLIGQSLMLGPAILLAIAGLLHLLASRAMRTHRTVGWACVTCFLLLLVLHGKAYITSDPFIQRSLRRGRRHWGPSLAFSGRCFV
jgi:hypothetical protein